MKNLKTSILAFLATLAAMFTSTSAFALSEADNTAVTAGFASGGTSVSTVVAGVIGIAVLMTGLSLVYSWLKK